MTSDTKQTLVYASVALLVAGFAVKLAGASFALRAANNAEAAATNELRRKSQEMDFGRTFLRIIDPLGLLF